MALSDEQAVRKADLALHHFVFVQLVIGVLGIDQGDDRVEQEFVGDLVIHEERLGHRAGVRETGGFDHHALEIQLAGALFRRQIAEHARQIAANRAADAAVAHLDNLFVRVLHEDLVVDVLFAELVFDHGDFHAVLFIQDALEQGGFAAAEKAGQDSDGNHGGRLLVRESVRESECLPRRSSRSVIETYLPGCCRGRAAALPLAAKYPPTMGDQAICNNRPFRYSPSGKAVSSGWSTPAPRRLRMRASTRASAAAPATIFWNSSASIAPEHE